MTQKRHAIKSWLLKIVWEEVVKKIPETIYSIIRTFVVVGALVLIVWLFGGRPDLYKSFQNVIRDFVALRLEPRSALYTQFPNEYKLGEYGTDAVIQNGGTLTINTSEKPIWIGIKNNENISLRNVLFILIMPQSVMSINEEKWNGGWRKMDVKNGTGYFTQLVSSIQPERGAHFDPPIEVRFPKPGQYIFLYKYMCDDFSPKEGYFIIKVLSKEE